MQFTSGDDQKTQFGFKELSSRTGVKPYVLRFWESEFSQITPAVDSAGNKIYSVQDKTAIEKIKHLLFEKKLSIQEAKGELALVNDSLASSASELESQLVAQKENTLSEGRRIFSHQSSLQLMQQSLASDLQQREVSRNTLAIDFSQKDLLSILQAKKKLKSVLTRIEALTSRWS